MITFLDENDVEYGALATIKATNAVNGERSLTGTIVSGDYVLSNIERGWRLRFDDEYYVVTYAKPIDEGRDVQVEFDAVHQFFWDFDKSSVYDQLSDGSHTFVAYLDFIFKNSGYSYTVDSALNVYAFEKQSFGFKKRLTLFNDIITSTGVEFQVNGKVVRILEKVGTDLSTVVRKNFNMNELTIEKNIGDFVTYQKGFGAYFDEEDHSKGRLEVEYTSALASVYGKLEAEPFVDERYSQSSSLLAVLKANVDNSYTISVSLDMEDLTRAGYRYTQPVAGDYIMAINETLGFKEKIRIVSFTSEYDVAGQLIKHTVTCNDIGSVKKLSASYTHTQHQAANAEQNANTAYEFANKALVSANGKNTNYYGDTFPVDNPKGTLKKGDLLFLTVGDTVKQYYWNGADWVINPVLDDVEAFKEHISEELKDVPNREEFENKISEEIANSKAEIGTQIETAKTQAESNAKEYADTINQETAKVAELANAAAGEIKADLVNVKNNLTETSLVANNAQAAVDAAKQDLTNVTNELNTAKQDLTSHAQQLQTQANAQTELTRRVTTVETTANGTKTTVSELSKTVDSNTKNITSVTARTKVVEDDLTNTKTTLSQVQTTADGASSKAATLETGLDGVKADLAATTATADTTKTNLANYQASNDRAVANLQSNLQEANGNISSLKTKVEAVPGQITSAVSAVESKIPTSLDSLNLMTGTRDWSTKANTWHMGEGWSIESEEYQGLKVHSTQKGWNGSHQNIFVKNGDVITFSFFAKATNTLSRITVSSRWNGSSVYQAPLAGVKESDEEITVTNEWKRYSKTIHITSDGSLQFRTECNEATIPNGNTFYVAGLKVAKSSQDTGYSENPTDAASDITKLNTTLTQTADGLKQLSTQVTSQSSTITSHTNSINSLTTGLQAKVSQTEFNTLSGRVATAENNITAKANELSSKITSVEGKIPTEIGAVNLFKGSRDFSTSNWINNGNGAYAEDYQGVKIVKTSAAWNGRSQFFEVKTGEEYVFSAYVKSSAKTEYVGFYLANPNKQPTASGLVSFGSVSNQDSLYFEVTDKYKRIAIKIKITNDGWIMPRIERSNSDAYLFFGGYKLERGTVATDYSPNPEDYDSKLSTAQSEFKQTTDAIKASVSSLDSSTVKSSSLTINADGIVMKAGKSTTDVANAIGSYFAVNQNAINLFSDKINVKGNMIVSGAITSDKIASKSINTAHLNGKIITADVIATNAITANAIKAGAVTTDKMSANSINGDRIAAGTLDAAKIKAGSITASQIASGTITSNQIKAGGISSANIAAGAITTDKIAAGAIDANKIAANAITANMIRGGKLNSTNGATVFDLNAGTLTFNNNSGYIQRVASDKIFEITTYLGKSLGNSQEYLTSDFTIRKSDNSRRSGIQFQLYTMVDNQPTATAKINADSLNLYNSQNTKLFSINGSSTWLGNFNMQGWGDIPVAQIYGGLLVKDIGIGGRSKSLLKIVEELCNKTGIWWM